MPTIETIKAIKDYGTLAVLAIAITWFNVRLNEVEDRLYDCFEDRINEKQQYYPIQAPLSKSFEKTVGILPERIRIRKNGKDC